MTNGRVVYGQEAQRFDVKHPHRQRIAFKEHPIVTLGLKQLLFDLALCGDVSGDSLQLNDLAILYHELDVLANPNLDSIFGDGRKLKVSDGNLVLNLLSVESEHFFTVIVAD